MWKVFVFSFSGHINSLFRNLWASGKSVRENEVVFTGDEFEEFLYSVEVVKWLLFLAWCWIILLAEFSSLLMYCTVLMQLLYNLIKSYISSILWHVRIILLLIKSILKIALTPDLLLIFVWVLFLLWFFYQHIFSHFGCCTCTTIFLFSKNSLHIPFIF